MNTPLPKLQASGILKAVMLFALFLMLFSFGALAVTRTATTSGSWFVTATWGGNPVPVDGDDVIIPSGITVSIDGETENYFGETGVGLHTAHSYVQVNGKLVLGASVNYVKFYKTIKFLVKNGGEVNCATVQGQYWVGGVLGISSTSSMLMYIESGGKYTISLTPQNFFGIDYSAINDSQPISSGTQTEPFQLNPIAFDAGMTNGAVQIATFGLTAPTPTAGVAPSITNATSGAGHIKAGGVDIITIAYSAVVNVNGLPYIPITLNSGTAAAVYFSGTGTNTLSFRYTAGASDEDPDGLTVGNAIALNGGTIKSAGGTDASLTFTSPSGTMFVDNIAPTASSLTLVNTSPTKATTLKYTLSFSENVFPTSVIAGVFTLTKTGSVTGAITNVANIDGTPGAASQFLVQVDGVSGDGTLRVDLNSSGTGITDLAGNSLVGGATGGTYTVDNTPPTALAVSFTSSNVNNGNIAVVGDVVSVNFQSSETIQSGTVTIAGHPATAVYQGSNNQWKASYTMTAGDTFGRIPFTLAFTDVVGNTSSPAITDVTTSSDIEFENTDATLTNLVTSAGTLDQTFNPATLAYTQSVPNSRAKLTVTPTTSDANSTMEVSINGGDPTAVYTGNPSTNLPLATGDNIIWLTVTAQDGVTSNRYVVTVNRALSPRDSLSSLLFDKPIAKTKVAGPDFADFTATVGSDVTSIKAIPTARDTSATITVNGETVASGDSSSPITLNKGDNVITTVVTAEDGSTKTYVVTITRPLSNNAFEASVTYSPNLARTAVTGPGFANYTASVNYGVSFLIVTTTTRDINASIKVNNDLIESGAGLYVSLDVGVNVITTHITAEDGTTKDYIVTVTRGTSANLLSLTYSPNVAKQKVTGPDFADYTATVKNTVTSIQLTPTTIDPTATVTVNGTAVTSGTASDPIALNVGDNIITTTVTTTDNATKSYVITITRQPSTDAFLTSLTFDPNIRKTASKGPGDYNYTASVDHSVNSINITPVTRQPTSSVMINGIGLPSGNTINVEVNVGSNTYTTVVTAEDGVTTRTYVVTIERADLPPSAYAKYDSKSETAINNADIVVHQNVSPNGDGRGDGLVIEGIAAHPDNKLQIMSRSGTLVYEARGYDNAAKVFDGHANNGKLQVAGTYFYSLEYKDGSEIRHKTGYIVLKY